MYKELMQLAETDWRLNLEHLYIKLHIGAYTNYPNQMVTKIL